MKHDGPQGARAFCNNDVVIVGIGVGDAAAPRRYAIETALEKRFEKDEERARPRHLLRVDQLLAAPELARCNVILDARDNHRDNGERLRNTRSLGDHAWLHDLRFDLSKAGLQSLLTGT